jgi:hypothetical protein
MSHPYLEATASSRVYDPADPSRIFQWPLSTSYDSNGNVMLFQYKAEDSVASPANQANEKSRSDTARRAGR